MKTGTHTEYFDGIPVTSETYETASRAEFVAQPGDVIRFEHAFRVVLTSSPSRCTHQSLTGTTKSVTVRKGFDDERTFSTTTFGDPESCAQRLPTEMLVHRFGADGLEDYQQAINDGALADWLQKTPLGPVLTERITEMKKNAKTKAAKKPIANPRGGLAADAKRIAAEKGAGAKKTATTKTTTASASKSTRVKIFGHSAYQIAVTLGRKGVSEPRTAAIIAKAGSDLARSTIKSNHSLGATKSEKGNPAKLSEDELKSLLDSVPEEPATEATASK